MSGLDFTAFQGIDSEVAFARDLQRRHLFTGKRSPRLMQRQNKAMRTAGLTWTQIDTAFRASGSLKWHYPVERIENLTYTDSPFLSLMRRRA